MSAIAALKGYRTQFLYSLHYILNNINSRNIIRLEGEEDLDVLSENGELLYAIQLKNLSGTLNLSDLLSENKTSFIKRYLNNYPQALPILVSYGSISPELLQWKNQSGNLSEKDKKTIKKYGISADEWKKVKARTEFLKVEEDEIASEVIKLVKENFPLIDPIPTIGYLLQWLQETAEKQRLISAQGLFSKVELFGIYISKRIAIHEQYGAILRPLHKVSTEETNRKLLEKEFYNATLTRYEHILLGLEVERKEQLEKLKKEFEENSVVIVKGASGQGKTALIYSFTNRYANDLLSFELNVQQDAIASQQSILAIASICDKLDVPAVFIINVLPNSKEWLNVVRETSHLIQVKFLIAIRSEDWYRASAIGIEFEHTEFDLELSEQEAKSIYDTLNERDKILNYTDFEEAWIKAGQNSPLLEFVFSLTQGDSLRNKLKQQVLELVKQGNSENNQEIELLMSVCLADAYGAKIDISKLPNNSHLKFTVEKLENEYLLKISSDKKYLQGLHIVRSKLLVDLLFDEFTVFKADHALKCLPIIAGEDLHLFIVQLLHQDILTTDLLLTYMNNLSDISWALYGSTVKALVWAGARKYVSDNRAVIEECRSIYGDGWLMLLDFTFGTAINIKELLTLIRFDDEAKEKNRELNNRLTNKDTLFDFAHSFFIKVQAPKCKPDGNFEWRCFGEVLFWNKSMPSTINLGEFNYTETDFLIPFQQMDSFGLSKLMLGLSLYSEQFDIIRQKYAHFFLGKLKLEYQVLKTTITEDEISVDYIVDILNDQSKSSTNEYSVKIIDLLRSAFPDKKKFSTKGHGHKLQTISSPVDDTDKSISIENLTLDEWIEINASIIALYEYENRPLDWEDYRRQLNDWERSIAIKIKQFNRSFTQLFRDGKTHSPIIPILAYQYPGITTRIKEPQSITDPLGIFVKRTTDNNLASAEKINKGLKSKYGQFFKTYSRFRGDIENFLSQSAKALAAKIKSLSDEKESPDAKTERLSQINLFYAIRNSIEFNEQYSKIFNNVDLHHLTRVQFDELLLNAVLWKNYLSGQFKGDNSHQKIIKLKTDFEKRIKNDCFKASKENNFSIKFHCYDTPGSKPILIIDSPNPISSTLAVKVAFYIVKNAIGDVEYTSLKYLMLDVWYNNFYFIQTIKGRVINNVWNEVRLYNIQGKEFDQLGVVGFQPMALDEETKKKLQIENWSNVHPAFKDITEAGRAFANMVFLVDHIYDLEHVANSIIVDSDDHDRLKEHLEKVMKEVQKYFQAILDYLHQWMQIFPTEDINYSEEMDIAYVDALINITDHIYPEPREDDNENVRIELDLASVSSWVERLKICSQSWSIFLLLLSGKFIELVNSPSN